MISCQNRPASGKFGVSITLIIFDNTLLHFTMGARSNIIELKHSWLTVIYRASVNVDASCQMCAMTTIVVSRSCTTMFKSHAVTYIMGVEASLSV